MPLTPTILPVSRRTWLIAATLAGALTLAPAMIQAQPATVDVGGHFIDIQTHVAHERSVLRISGPNGYALTLHLSEQFNLIEVDLLQDAEPRMRRNRQHDSEPEAWSSLPPGTYHYEIILYADGEVADRFDGVFHVGEDGHAFRPAPSHGASGTDEGSMPAVANPAGGFQRALAAVVDFLLPAARAQTFTADITIDKPTPALIFDSDFGVHPGGNWSMVGNSDALRIWDLQSDDGFSTNPFRIFTGSGNEHALSIMGSGNVGIGTSSPQRRLHAINDGGFQMRLSGQGIDTEFDSFGNYFSINHGSVKQFRLHRDAPGESLTIAGNGAIGLGTDTPERQLHLKGNNAVFRMDRPTDTAAFLLVRTGAGGTPLKTFVVGTNASGANNGEFIINDLGAAVGGSGARRMTITNNGEAHFTGTVRTPSLVQTSSARFKENVATLEHASDALRRLRGVRYTWKESGNPSVGLIAEEVQAVYPELVETENGQAVAINYSALIGVLVEAHKEQQQAIADYRSEVAAQQARITRLETELAGYANVSAELQEIKALISAQHLRTASTFD